MIYIYDILLNWTDTDKIYEFFEWQPNDMIEHVKKMPLLKIAGETLSHFMNDVVKVERSFLEKIDQKSEIFCQKKTECIAFACLLTDGKRVVAVEFDDDGRSIYRSHLLLDEEVEILEISERLNEQEVPYHIVDHYEEVFYLTRQEEMMKRYLLRELKNTYQHKNYQKLHYLYSEYFDDDIQDPQEMYQKFLESIQKEFNEKHQRIYELLKLSHTKKQV